MELTLYKENTTFHLNTFVSHVFFVRVRISLFLRYLAGRTFLHGANDRLTGQVNQDVGAVVIQSHIVAIKSDDT